jgi:catechol 2,3-dioxygenase-like lactoylglutathione lyase family enzyme
MEFTRRTFFGALLAGVAASAERPAAAQQSAGRVAGFDHVALPMSNVDAMIVFYKALGFTAVENTNIVSVYAGNQMINFHRPSLWQNQSFTLRAPAANPPCGDLCFVWEGSEAALKAMLERVGAKVEVGPVQRSGGRQRTGSSTYTRDPDGNLLEFIVYS